MTMEYIKNKRIVFLLIFLLSAIAFLIRVAYVVNTSIDHPIRADAREYVIYAHNLYKHGIFSKEFPADQPSPDSFRSPGYPMFLCLFFHLDKETNLYSVIYAQTVLSTLLVPLTFLIGIRIFSFLWAFIGACLVAFSPHLVSITSYILTETLFGFLFLAALVLLSESLRKNMRILFLMAGFFFGLAYLVNETVLFFPYIVSFAYILYFRKTHGKTDKLILSNIVLFLIIFSVFPAAWGIRNKINLPLDAPKGSHRAIGTMTHGTYPDFIYKTEKYRNFPYREDPMQPAFSSSMGNFVRIFWTRFKERPIRYLSWYFFEKPYYLWSWNILQGQGDVYIYPVTTSLYQVSKAANLTREIMKFIHPAVLIFALLGIPLFIIKLRAGKKDLFAEQAVFLLFIIIVYYTLLYTVFAPWPRYSIPLRPELYLWSLWSLKESKDIMSKCYKK